MAIAEAIYALLLSSACVAQTKTIDPDARRHIDAGNQQWIDGMKQHDLRLLTAAYTIDAVDCSAEGNCIRGLAAIEEHVKRQMAMVGKADSASVTSIGSVQRGSFVYEWGQAEAHFAGGKDIVDRYLTVWRKQSDGTWKIFRNLVIPE
jgi:ketosteroid isomerase-like protein